MNHPRKSLLLPLLSITLALATVASVGAQERHDSNGNTSGSLQVTLGSAPQWSDIRGTRVQEIRDRDSRPEYDMFRYGRNYYVYDNNQWYSSRHDRGRFTRIDERRLPGQINRVPREHWRNYPSGWGERNPMMSPGKPKAKRY